MLRPYVKVNSIPNFDPTALPYWSLYSEKTFEDGKQNVSYNPSVQIGGTMAGQFTKGLSGGQRKMLLFELVKQRTAGSSDLLLVLDEPFAGVTDDFVPFIVMRLNEMRQKHNILLVTNDHVHTLTEMADSTVVVSAVDRSKVCVDSKEYDRELFLHAVASGAEYEGGVGSQDLRFFAATELSPRNPNIQGVLGFTAFAMVMFLLTFWDSRPGSEALLLVGLQIVAFFAINPYLIHLTDWRNTMAEEAAALMHVSAQANLALKAGIVLSLMLLVSSVSFGMVQACTDTLRSGRRELLPPGPLSPCLPLSLPPCLAARRCFSTLSPPPLPPSATPPPPPPLRAGGSSLCSSTPPRSSCPSSASASTRRCRCRWSRSSPPSLSCS